MVKRSSRKFVGKLGWAIAVFMVLVIGGYTLGKDLAVRDNKREEARQVEASAE